MSDLFPITTTDMLAELRRELSLRQRVYRHLVLSGKLRQPRADRQIAILEAVIARLDREYAECTRRPGI